MKAIQRNITIIIWVCSVLITGVAIKSGYEVDVTKFIAIAMFSVSTISTVLYFIPINERVKAVIVLSMVGMGCLGASIGLGGNSGTFLVSYLVLGTATLYFDPIILLVYALIYLPIACVAYFVNPEYIVGPVSPHMMGIFELISYTMVTVCCYIGTREGSRLMRASVQDEKDTQEKANLIQQISESAQEDSVSIGENIVCSNEIVQIIAKGTDIVNENIETLQNSENETMERLQRIHEQIGRSTEWIEANYELVNALETNFADAISNVEESMEYKENASNSLQEILSTIQNAVECITKSGKQTEEINKIIKDMEEIASSTNMLATNASIEAARVGDLGHGFRIVAEQIKELSVQSKDASKKIRAILDQIAQALMTTESKVKLGLNATELGISNLNHMGKEIEAIHMYSRQSQSTLVDEVEVFEKLKEEFTAMLHEVERNKDTAKSNVDKIHEVADTAKIQTNRMTVVSNHINEMEELSDQMKQHFA